jgi:hypothetical protein
METLDIVYIFFTAFNNLWKTTRVHAEEENKHQLLEYFYKIMHNNHPRQKKKTI